MNAERRSLLTPCAQAEQEPLGVLVDEQDLGNGGKTGRREELAGGQLSLELVLTLSRCWVHARGSHVFYRTSQAESASEHESMGNVTFHGLSPSLSKCCPKYYVPLL